MINLNDRQNGIWNNDGPKHSRKNAVNHEENAADKIHQTHFFQIFQDEAGNDKKGGGIAEIRGDFRAHSIKFSPQT